MHIQIATADAEEIAAVLAAIACVLADEASAEGIAPAAQRSAWHSAALLEAQGTVAGRSAQATWPGVARTSRSRRWSKGIV